MKLFFLLIVLAFLGCGDSGAARFPSIEDAVPMERSTPEELGIEPFQGQAITPTPTAPQVVGDHPLLNNEGQSRIHNNHYNTGAYSRASLLGPDIDIVTNRLGEIGVCAMLTFLANGYVIGSCFRAPTISEGVTVYLVMFDNDNLNIVAKADLGPRDLIPNAAGGAYFSLDKDENILIGPATNKLEQYHIEVVDDSPQFVQDFSVDISGQLPLGALLQDTVLDYEGRLWFMATTGHVGYLDTDTEEVTMISLADDIEDCNGATDEEILQNSMVTDEEAVYVVTCARLYRLVVDSEGAIEIDWRNQYDDDTGGVLLPGSGTSPSLFGKNDDLITICDAAAPQINVLVFDRTTGAEVCKQPLFRENESATENSSSVLGDDVVIANNAGFGGAFAPARTMKNGLERYRVRADRSGCDEVWVNDDAIANSNQLSVENGVIYGWSADPEVEDADHFYLSAYSWETGAEIFRTYIGDRRSFDPLSGQVHMHPDGKTLYLGAVEGVIMMRDVN